MWRKRNHILKAATKAIITVLGAGGSALGLIYDKGAGLVSRSRALMPDPGQSELEGKILKSIMRIATLKSEIVKERARLKYFSLLRRVNRH